MIMPRSTKSLYYVHYAFLFGVGPDNANCFALGTIKTDLSPTSP